MSVFTRIHCSSTMPGECRLLSGNVSTVYLQRHTHTLTSCKQTSTLTLMPSTRQIGYHHLHSFIPWPQHPRPRNLKIIHSQWTGSLCVKVMFGLAGNQPKPANQYARTKCFCLHLEYLNAAELPHVNQREIEKKRAVRNAAQERRTANENKPLFLSYFAEKLKNINVLFYDTETHTDIEASSVI